MAQQNEQQKTAHLLRRFGLGASEAEVDYYSQDGLQGAIDKLLNYEQVDEGFPIELQDLANQNGNVNALGVQAWWYLRLLATRRPLEQKMTIFWHDHFATSAAKVDVTPALYNHLETLRTNATGNFLDLLTAISKDPAMLYWLDCQENVKESPNENFSREVMELFTLGVDNGYTEEDIQEAARAFTGWTFGASRGQQVRRFEKPFRQAKFVNDKAKHDNSEKTILGKVGNFDGDDVLKLLCDQPGTAHNLTKKMWEWFAYENPDVNLISRLATNWMKKDLDINYLVRSIMESEEFYSEKAIRAKIKNPIDYCISGLRAIGIGRQVVTQMSQATEFNQKRRGIQVGRVVASRTKSMGMALLFPPDVSGWISGEEWISTATMVERIKFADFVFGTSGRNIRQYVQVSFSGLSSSPDEMVDTLLSVFDAQIPQAKIEIVKKRAMDVSGGTLTRENRQETMEQAATLIFGSPEFQFC